jgi:mannose-6-phosphate isomerase-like protein (cupin superfamily)
MDDAPRPHHVETTYVHFADAGVSQAIDVTPSFWPDLMSGKRPDLEGGRLMTYGEVAGDWDSWEMHPRGDELVLLLSGSVTLLLEHAGETKELVLNTAGAFAIIPRGTWHTIRTKTRSSLLFVTPGQGTEHRS